MRLLGLLVTLCGPAVLGNPDSRRDARSRPIPLPLAAIRAAGDFLLEGVGDVLHGHLSLNGFVVLALLAVSLLALILGRRGRRRAG
jgi:hypothetical protein